MALRLPDEVAATLKSYVYVYIDPRDGATFYIGEGVGNRAFAHLDDQTDCDKVRRIAEIRVSGHEPRIDFLRYGLSDDQARLVEAAAIDLLGKRNLANAMVGFHDRSYPRINSREVIAMLTAKPVEVRHKAMLITIT